MFFKKRNTHPIHHTAPVDAMNMPPDAASSTHVSVTKRFPNGRKVVDAARLDRSRVSHRALSAASTQRTP